MIPAAEETMAAPQNLKAVRAVDGEVQLTWSPVDAEEEAVTYNVYRQIGEGEWIQIETENPSSTFTDTMPILCWAHFSTAYQR